MIRLKKLEGMEGIYGYEEIDLIHCRVIWTEDDTSEPKRSKGEPLFNVFEWVVIADGTFITIMEDEINKKADHYIAYPLMKNDSYE